MLENAVPAVPLKGVDFFMKILIADDDLDSHELVRDILQINFRDVEIDRALSSNSFLTKIQEAKPQYDLVLYNLEMENDENNKLLSKICSEFPAICKRTVLFSDSKPESMPPEFNSMPFISKPFSLDQFGEVVKKTCAS